MRTQKKVAPEKKLVVLEGQNVVLVESAPDSKNEITRATLSKFKGVTYCRVGKWYRNAEQVWAPGKGISMPFDPEGVEKLQVCISAIVAALPAYE